MKKNVASQNVGAQLIASADGTAFTSSVTVKVTGDAGTQATGSVGSGACTHEGNGYHTYAPAQAETNYDLVAFTFIGTGAIPATIQIYTSFPQTGDNFARLGAPAGASVSADVAAVKTAVDTVDDFVDTEVSAILAAVDTEVAAIKTTTDKFVFTVANQVDSNVIDWKGATAPAMTGDAFARLGAPAGASVSADIALSATYIDTEVAAIKAKTDNLPASFPSNFASLAITSGGRVAIQDAFQKNTAKAGFQFPMTDSTTHAPKTGVTVTSQRSINGGAFASTTNSATEISNGAYTIDLSAADLNGDFIMLRFTGTASDDVFIGISTFT